MTLNDVKLGQAVFTKIGLLTPIKTKKEGMEVYQLICQNGSEQKVLRQTLSETKIIHETYLAIYKN